MTEIKKQPVESQTTLIVNQSPDHAVSDIAGDTCEATATIQNALNSTDEQEQKHATDLIEKFFTDGKMDMPGLAHELGLADDKELKAEVSRRDSPDDEFYNIYIACEFFERFFKHMGILNKNGNYTSLLAHVTDAFIALKSPGSSYFAEWSRYLCRCFEIYQLYTDGKVEKKNNFLDSEHNLKSAEKLVDEAVKRSLELKPNKYITRMIFSLVDYNILKLDGQQLDGKFAFKPNSLTKPEFCQLIKHKKEQILLQAATPREMLIKLCRS